VLLAALSGELQIASQHTPKKTKQPLHKEHTPQQQGIQGVADSWDYINPECQTGIRTRNLEYKLQVNRGTGNKRMNLKT